MKRLRIAMVLHDWPATRAGGTGLVVEALARAHRALGHRVCILAPNTDVRPPLDRQFEFIGVPKQTPTRWSETWHHPEQDRFFRDFVTQWAPDIVHIHHLSGLSLGLVEVAKTHGARVVLCLHDYAIPCIRGQLVTHEGTLCPGPDAKGCGRCMSHTSAGSPRLASMGRWVQRLPRVQRAAKQVLRRIPQSKKHTESAAASRIVDASKVLDRVDRLEAPSRDLCDRIEGMGFRRPDHVPLPLVHPIVLAPDPGDGPVRFLFIGSLIPTKGPLRLLDAFRALAPGRASLSILGAAVPFFGSHEYHETLRERVARTPGAQLLAPVSSSEIQPVMDAHDVLVLPSTWPENSPLVIREASAAGLRTMWSEVGGAHELDPRGRPIPIEPASALVEALQKETEIGRMRHSPLQWPSPEEVAMWHIANSY